MMSDWRISDLLIDIAPLFWDIEPTRVARSPSAAGGRFPAFWAFDGWSN